MLSGANSGGLGRRREQGSQACVENPSLAYVPPLRGRRRGHRLKRPLAACDSLCRCFRIAHGK